LQILEIKGCIVTIDAMGCQKEIAKKIVEQEADYCLALKANHQIMYGEVEEYFQKEIKLNFIGKEVDYHQTIDKGHGRLESRKYWVTSDIDFLSQKTEWINLASVVCVESGRTIEGKTSIEFRYYISSLPADAKLLAYAVRSHWGVENSLHWVLDVAFREDISRIRKTLALRISLFFAISPLIYLNMKLLLKKVLRLNVLSLAGISIIFLKYLNFSIL
jgi:predicted transposase YbfD/YdcC